MDALSAWVLENAPPAGGDNAIFVKLAVEKLAQGPPEWAAEALQAVQERLEQHLRSEHPTYVDAARALKAHWLRIVETGTSDMTGLPSWAGPLMKQSAKRAEELRKLANLSYEIHHKHFDTLIVRAVNAAEKQRESQTEEEEKMGPAEGA